MDGSSDGSETISNYTTPTKTKEQWLEEGIAYYRARNYVKALIACEQAIQLDHNYFLAHYGKGLALYDLGHYLNALTAFEQAVQLNPTNDWAYVGIGNIFYQLKRYKEALAAFERALQLNATNLRAQQGKLSALDELKRYRESHFADEQSVQHDQSIVLHSDETTGYQLEDALYKLKREEAIRLDPDNENIYLAKGNALLEEGKGLYKLGHYEEALALY